MPDRPDPTPEALRLADDAGVWDLLCDLDDGVGQMGDGIKADWLKYFAQALDDAGLRVLVEENQRLRDELESTHEH